MLICTGCSNGADIVIALDNSGTIGQQNFAILLEFIARLITQLDISNTDDPQRGTRIGFMSYTDVPELHFQLNTYDNRYSILNALNIPYRAGKTYIPSAIE